MRVTIHSLSLFPLHFITFSFFNDAQLFRLNRQENFRHDNSTLFQMLNPLAEVAFKEKRAAEH